MKVKVKKLLASFVAAATAFMCMVVAVPKIEVSAAAPLGTVTSAYNIPVNLLTNSADINRVYKIVANVTGSKVSQLISTGGSAYGYDSENNWVFAPYIFKPETIADLAPHDYTIDLRKEESFDNVTGYIAAVASVENFTVNSVKFLDADDNEIETKTVGQTVITKYEGSQADITDWNAENAAAITKVVFNIDADISDYTNNPALCGVYVTAGGKTVKKIIGCKNDPDDGNDYSETDLIIGSAANNSIEIDFAGGITDGTVTFGIQSGDDDKGYWNSTQVTLNAVSFLDAEGNVVYQLPADFQPASDPVPAVPANPTPEEPTPEEPTPEEPEEPTPEEPEEPTPEEPEEPTPVDPAPAVPEEPAETIPDDGEVTVEPAVVGAGAPEIKVENTETVKEAVGLTSEEKAAVEAGADVKITLSVEKADDTVPPAEKAAIEEAAPENFEVGIFLDIKMDKQVGQLAKKAVSTLMKKIGITVAVPEGLINTDDTVNREYVIIHCHNGLTEVIPGSFNPVTKEITFPTDKFSTYAIAYKDTPKAAEAEPAVPTYSVTVDGSATVTGDRTAGSEITVTVPFGMTARVYSGNTLIATFRDSGKFTMPAGDVKVIVTDESGAGIMASTAPSSYIFSYDGSMKLIKTTRSKKGISGTGEITVNLGADRAGKKVTLYSGKKSTSEKLEEAVLDSKGSATFTVKGAKNYTLVVED